MGIELEIFLECNLKEKLRDIENRFINFKIHLRYRRETHACARVCARVYAHVGACTHRHTHTIKNLIRKKEEKQYLKENNPILPITKI